MMAPWRDSPVDYEAGLPLGKRDRPIWVITTDREGRTDGYTIGHLHGEHGDNFEAERAASIAWRKTPARERGPSPSITIVPWLNVPQLGVDDKLSNWWNIKAWAEVDTPEVVPALWSAVRGLKSIRDFLGLQLDHAQGNIERDEFEERAAAYLRDREGALTRETEEQIRILAGSGVLDAETLSEVFNIRYDDAIRIVARGPK